MGDLLDRLNTSPRDLGGQRHSLPGILAGLPRDVAEDLLAILAQPAPKYAVLARIMRDEYGYDHSLSTWSRWAGEIRAGRVFVIPDG